MTTAFDYLLDAVNRRKQQRVNPGITVSSPQPQMQAPAPMYNPAADNMAIMQQAINDTRTLGIQSDIDFNQLQDSYNRNAAIADQAIRDARLLGFEANPDATLENIGKELGIGAARTTQGIISESPGSLYDFSAKHWQDQAVPSVNNQFIPLSDDAVQELQNRAENTAEFLRNNSAVDALNQVQEDWQNPLTGTLAGQTFEAVGGMLPSVLAGNVVGRGAAALGQGIEAANQLGNAANMATMLTGAYGNSYNEARDQGADVERAMAYGLANAGIEGLTENMNHYLPGMLGQAPGLSQMVGEAQEEMLGAYLEPLANMILEDNKTAKDWANSFGNALNQDFGIGDTWQDTYNKIMAGDVSGEDLLNSNLANKALEAGAAGISAMGSTLLLGGMTDPVGTARNLQQDVQTIANDSEVADLFRSNDYANESAFARQQMDILNGLKSTQENEAQKTVLKEELRQIQDRYATPENLISEDRAVRNAAQLANTEKIQQMLADHGITGKYADNVAKLCNKLGLTVEYSDSMAPNENGKIQDGRIVISADSKDPFATVFSHEMTHSIEKNTDVYVPFRDALYELAESGVLKSKYGSLQELQEKIRSVYGNDPQVVETETVAFLSQELLGSEDAINYVCKNNRGLGARILNSIDDVIRRVGSTQDMIRAAEAADDQAFQKAFDEFKKIDSNKSLQKARDIFKAALTDAEITKQYSPYTEVSYSKTAKDLSDNGINVEMKMSFQDAVDAVLNNKVNPNEGRIMVRKDTPAILMDSEKMGEFAMKKNLPMLVKIGHITNAVGRSSRKANYQHHLTPEMLYKIPEAMENPLFIYGNKSHSTVNMVLDMYAPDSRGEYNPVVVAVTPDSSGMYINVLIPSNTINTIFDYEKYKDDLDQLLETAIYPKDITKEELLTLWDRNQLQLADDNSSNINISEFEDKSSNSNPQYSLSLDSSSDSDGHQLTVQQQEYFKNSKIRNENGSLKVMYHGTSADFNIFDTSISGGKNGTAEGFGLYFSDSPDVASTYGDKTKTGYLNIKRPASSTQKTIKQTELQKLIKTTAQNEAQEWVNDGDYDSVDDALKDTWISNYTYTYDKPINQSYAEVARKILETNDNDMGIVQEVMTGLAIRDYEDANKFYDLLTDTTGIDGFETEWKNRDTGDTQQIVLAFRSNQFKNIDNTSPTDNPDIRYSYSLDNAANVGQGSSRSEQFNAIRQYGGKMSGERLTPVTAEAEQAAREMSGPAVRDRNRYTNEYDRLMDLKTKSPEARAKINRLREMGISMANEATYKAAGENAFKDYNKVKKLVGRILDGNETQIINDYLSKVTRNGTAAADQWLTENYENGDYAAEVLAKALNRSYIQDLENKAREASRKRQETVRAQKEKNTAEYWRKTVRDNVKNNESIIDELYPAGMMGFTSDVRERSYGSASEELAYANRTGYMPDESYSSPMAEVSKWLEHFGITQKAQYTPYLKQIAADMLQNKTTDPMLYQRFKEAVNADPNLRNQEEFNAGGFEGMLAQFRNYVGRPGDQAPAFLYMSSDTVSPQMRDLLEGAIASGTNADPVDVQRLADSFIEYAKDPEDILYNDYYDLRTEFNDKYQTDVDSLLRPMLERTQYDLMEQYGLNNFDRMTAAQPTQEMAAEPTEYQEPDYSMPTDEDAPMEYREESQSEQTADTEEDNTSANAKLDDDSYWKELSQEVENGNYIQPELFDPDPQAKAEQSVVRQRAAQMREDIDTIASMGKNLGGTSKTLEQNGDMIAGKNEEVREAWKRVFEDPLYRTKKVMFEDRKAQYAKVNHIIKDLGIKPGSKESAALQYYVEGTMDTNATDASSKRKANYGLENLKKDFPKTWQNIVEAEKILREIYDDQFRKVNSALEKIYPEQKILEEAKKIREMTSNQINEKQAYLNQLMQDPQNNRLEIERYRRDIRKLSQRYNNADRTARQNKRLNYRSDYITHFNEVAPSNRTILGMIGDVIKNKGNNNISNKLSGISEFTKPNTKWAGFMQQRGAGQYKADAIGAIQRYLPQANQKAYMDLYTAYMRGVISEMRNAADDAHVDQTSMIRWLTHYTNDIAGKTNPYDRWMESAFNGKGRQVITVFKRINSKIKANAVMGNMNSAIAQFYNLPNGIAVLQEHGKAKAAGDWAKGLNQYMVEKFAPEKLADQSVFLTERYFDDSYGFLDDSILKKPEQFANWMMQFGDKEVAHQIWYAAYHQGVRLNEANPIQYADEMTRRSVAGRGIGEVPVTQQAQITKLIAPFQVEVNNQFQLLKHLVGDKEAGALLAMFISAYLMNRVKEKATHTEGTGLDPLADIQDALKNGETGGEKLLKAITYTTGDVISNMPFGAQFMYLLGMDDNEEVWGKNDPTRYGIGNIGIQGLTEPLLQAASGHPEKIDWVKLATNYGPGFGGKQMERTYKWARDAGYLPWSEEGAYNTSGRLKYVIDNDDLGNNIRGALFGTYATEQGKEYLDNEYSAFSENRTAAFEGMRDVSDANASDIYQTMRQASQLQRGVDYPENTQNAQGMATRKVYEDAGLWDTWQEAYSNAEDPDAFKKATGITNKVADMDTDEFDRLYTEMINGAEGGPSSYSFSDTRRQAYDSLVNSGVDEQKVYDGMMAADAKNNIKDADGETIDNSKAALNRQAYVDEGIWEDIVDLINSDENKNSADPIKPSDFGLNAKILSMKDADYQKILDEVNASPNYTPKERKDTDDESAAVFSKSEQDLYNEIFSKPTASRTRKEAAQTADEIEKLYKTAIDSHDKSSKELLANMSNDLSEITEIDKKLYNELIMNHKKMMQRLDIV